jgi:hypothetical protein
MARELPDEVYVITNDNEWPLTVVAGEAHAITAYERKVQEATLRCGDYRYAESKVRLRRCRLEVIEEMTILPPGKPKLVSKENAR